jgi:outer membrane autotransporter protein
MAGGDLANLRLAGMLRSASDSESQEVSRYTLWADGLGLWASQDGDDGFTGYDFDVAGGSVGLERLFGQRFIAGVGGGYSYTDVDFDEGRADAEIESIHASAYATWFTEHGYVEGSFGYARQDFDHRRRVRFGGTPRKAWSDHDADLYSVSLGAGYRFEVLGVGIRPFGRLNYLRLEEESFREKGAGDVSLDVSSKDTDALTSELGLRVAGAIDTRIGTFVPYASSAWRYDFDIDDRTLETGYLGGRGTSFRVDGRDVKHHGLSTGGGITYLGGRVSVTAEYLGEFREDYTGHGVFARMGVSF